MRNTDIVACAPGDIIRLEGPAGGGYGNPMERPVDRVVEDVECGFVSRERARQAYGVVIDASGVLDREATEALRAAQHAGPADAHFHYGPGRERFERVWTRARYAVLTRIMHEVPVPWRHFVKHPLFKVLAGHEAPAGDDGADVARAYAALAAQHADLPPVAAVTAGVAEPDLVQG